MPCSPLSNTPTQPGTYHLCIGVHVQRLCCVCCFLVYRGLGRLVRLLLLLPAVESDVLLQVDGQGELLTGWLREEFVKFFWGGCTVFRNLKSSADGMEGEAPW